MKPRARSPRKPKVLRILVAENHPDTRRGLEVFLKMLGHRAELAVDVHSALELAAAHPFDLLLSDINLPDGDGWELLRQLEEGGHRPPHAIAMSGFSSGADLAKSKAAGFCTHLIKPFPPEELDHALHKVAVAARGTGVSRNGRAK